VPPAAPSWKTSLVITAIVVALATVGVLTPWPWAILPWLGAGLFLYLELRNSRLWLRRAALLCINAGVVSAALPSISGRLDIDLGSLRGLLEFGGGTVVTLALLGVGAVLALVAAWSERGPANEAEAAAAAGGDGISAQELASYRAAVRKRHGFNHFVGFSTPVELAASWEDLYVELVMEGSQGHTGHPTFGDVVSRPAAQPDLRGAFDYARACNKQAMVLLGHPGSGKTTQLQQILLRVLDERGGSQKLGLPPDALAVLVPLRSMRLPAGKPAPPLQELLARALVEDLPAVAEDLARRLLASPHLVLLLDGLDEIPDAMERARVARAIERAQQHAAAGHVLVVSSRYAGYVGEANLGKAFLELRLRPLDDGQLGRLVHRWYRFVEAAEARIHRQMRPRRVEPHQP
jgi:NACHT domain